MNLTIANLIRMAILAGRGLQFLALLSRGPVGMRRRSIDEMAHSVRSLAFENEYTEYHLSGTCSAFTYRGEAYVGTPTHAMWGRGDDLVVHARRDMSDLSVPFVEAITLEPSPGLDQHAADLTLLRVASVDRTPEQREFLERIDLDELYPRRHLRPGDPLVLVGYPMERKEIRYEERVIRAQCVLLGATYERAESLGQVHVAKVPQPSPIESGDGFSGAAVFSITADEHVEAFEGVVVRSNLTGMEIVRFVDVDVLRRMLDRSRSNR